MKNITKTAATILSIIVLQTFSVKAQVKKTTMDQNEKTEMQKTHYNNLQVNGLKIFYREAGSKDAPVILLLHGYPTSSHMYRNLIPILSKKYHVIAPDLPGFGFSDAPDHLKFEYTFDNLANTM